MHCIQRLTNRILSLLHVVTVTVLEALCRFFMCLKQDGLVVDCAFITGQEDRQKFRSANNSLLYLLTIFRFHNPSRQVRRGCGGYGILDSTKGYVQISARGHLGV